MKNCLFLLLCCSCAHYELRCDPHGVCHWNNPHVLNRVVECDYSGNCVTTFFMDDGRKLRTGIMSGYMR